MSDPNVPPPPGVDTPVPSDTPTVDRRGPKSAPAPDALVPVTAVEQRKEARAAARAAAEERRRQQQVAAAQPWQPMTAVAPWQPPAMGASLPGGSVVLPDGRIIMQAAPPAQGQQPQPWQGQPVQAASYATPGYGGYPMPSYPALAQAPGYGYQAPPYGYPGYAMPAVMGPPPKRPFTKRQRRAALLGSLVGQTILAIAVHFIMWFFLVTGIIALMQSEVPNTADDPFGTFTQFVSYWTHPDRYWVLCIIAIIIFGALVAFGWSASAVWYRQARLEGVHGSIALAWLTTTVSTGMIGAVVWPMVVFGGLIAAFAAGFGGTTGELWMLAIVPTLVAALLCGAVGMLFGWMYLLARRPRPTFQQLEAEREHAARVAEQRALAADVAELTKVE